MKTKILLGSVLFFLTATLAAENPATPPSVTLDDGTKITLLGTTYGKDNVAPHYEHLGTGNWIHERKDVTVVWFEIEHDSKKWPSFSLLVSDAANTASVVAEPTSRSHVKEGVEVHGFVLRAYPRWDDTFVVRIASPYGKDLGKGKLVIANPKPGISAAATPEPLPATKSDGDLEVTLTRFVTAAPLPVYDRPTDAARGDVDIQCARLAFDIKQKGQTVTNWNPWVVETTDAAGNHVSSVLRFQDNEFMRQHMNSGELPPLTFGTNDDYKGYYYRPGLWPDEPAWNVRLEFTRSSRYDEDEILSLTNLPLREGTQEDYDKEWTGEPGQTNSPIGDYTVGGIKLKLFPPLLLPDPDHAGQKRLHVILRADPEPRQFRMALLEATNEEGRQLWAPFVTAGYNCTFEFPSVGEVKSFNLKFALHRSRYVTFTVKPDRQ